MSITTSSINDERIFTWSYLWINWLNYRIDVFGWVPKQIIVNVKVNPTIYKAEAICDYALGTYASAGYTYGSPGSTKSLESTESTGATKAYSAYGYRSGASGSTQAMGVAYDGFVSMTDAGYRSRLG